MKHILTALFFVSLTVHATATPEKTAFIETRLAEILHRIEVAKLGVLSELTPLYIEQDIWGLRRSILDLLTPYETDFISAGDREVYREWARVYNRTLGEYHLSHRVQLLPLVQKKYVPDLYRALVKQSGYPNNFVPLQWAVNVTRANFPIALRLLRGKGTDTVEMRQFYPSLLNSTRRIHLPQLRYLLLNFDQLWSDEGRFQPNFLNEVLSLSRSQAETRVRKMICESRLRIRVP